MIPKILVTGGNGQLATCIKDLHNDRFDIFFASNSDLDITSQQDVKAFFKIHQLDWCINCAAYTAVDKAESDSHNAYLVNVKGTKNLAVSCNEHKVKLVHISTDFVFDGEHNRPYKESDHTNPIGVYGQTKLQGEKEIINILKEHFIIRTSWLYSEHGNNFLKTMLRLAEERSQLGVVADQIGTPTYAKDLARFILYIIDNNVPEYGIYHYSNEGVASWYDFAKAIFDITGVNIKLKSISTDQFPTPAKRPYFSVLDKTKAKKYLDHNIPHWRDSLIKAIQNLKDE